MPADDLNSPQQAADVSREHEVVPELAPTSHSVIPGKERLGRSWLYPVAIALSTVLLGLVSIQAPVAAVIGSVGAGVLCLLRNRRLALAAAAALLCALVVVPWPSTSVGYWVLLGLLLLASAVPGRFSASLLRVAPATWSVCLLLCAVCICVLLLEDGRVSDFFVFLGALCASLLGAGLTRHLAMVDARLLAWGEEGLGAVTRDLLLGRITSGMLHDLSQPLNVISMANGNLGYITEHLQTDDKTRQQLMDRITRIASHTENAAAILSLFRWFGRNADQDEAELSVRNALHRAIKATRSNVRYHGVEVDIDGNALDLLVVRHHGRLEMMIVAALLSALSSYGSPQGDRTKGQIVIHANATAHNIVIEIACADETGNPIACKPLDNATLWLIEQMAQEGGGLFRCLAHRKEAIQFAVRVKREDV